MEYSHRLPQRYSVSLLNPKAGTISGTALPLSLFLSVKGTHSSIPEDDLKSLEEIQRTSVKLMDERNTRVEIQEHKWKEEKKKKAEENLMKEYLKKQREINLRNIQCKTHEATLTKHELKEERLDKFFALTQEMLRRDRESNASTVFNTWWDEKNPDGIVSD